MDEHRTVFLMYHELEKPGRPLCLDEPGYVRYAVRLSDFRQQMESLDRDGWRGLSVGEAIQFREEKSSVAITFDDGCETDLICAAPILREFGFGATFYVTAGFLEKPGYLSSAQLRELGSLGFEIGCHSMTHAYLTDLNDEQLHHEVIEAKLRLEQVIGRCVEHFSCPGGRYNERTLRVAREAGYRTVATSRIHANSKRLNPFRLGRVAVMRATPLAAFRDICRGHGLWQINLKVHLRKAAQKLMGNSAYDRLRAALLP
ncbi:MAG: polysaccharide deacetylase family protein [Candidatus Sulfotelmatobacter sp.]